MNVASLTYSHRCSFTCARRWLSSKVFLGIFNFLSPQHYYLHSVIWRIGEVERGRTYIQSVLVSFFLLRPVFHIYPQAATLHLFLLNNLLSHRHQGETRLLLFSLSLSRFLLVLHLLTCSLPFILLIKKTDSSLHHRKKAPPSSSLKRERGRNEEEISSINTTCRLLFSSDACSCAWQIQRSEHQMRMRVCLFLFPLCLFCCISCCFSIPWIIWKWH